MKKILILFTLTLVGFAGFSQKINFSAEGVKDTSIYMARYLGAKLFYADTTEIKAGKFSFDGSKHPAGLYAIIMPNGKYFEFIIDNEDVNMQVKDPNDLIGSMVVNKSVNNKVFYKYINFMQESKKEGTQLNEEYKKTAEDSPEREKVAAKMKDLNKRVSDYQKKLVAENGNLFVALMVKMSIDIELPEPPRNDEGVITDSNFVYHHYVNHYWDNFDLKDPRTVRAPIFHNKLDKFFSARVMIQSPDSIAYHAKKLIDKTDQEDQTNLVFQYIVHHVTNKYETSKIMGMDKVFCFMAQNYYCPPNNKAYWVTEENTTVICERAEKVCRTSPGSYAPMIILPDTTEENWINSHEIEAEYTVLFFWDPNCGHCKKVTPKLQTLYAEKFKDRNVEVYAIAKATGDDFEKWKTFIQKNELTFVNVGLTKSVYDIAMDEDQTELHNLLRTKTNLQSLNYSDTYDVYSTPRIYIIDQNKIIRYKQISIGQLEEIIDKLTGHEDDEKLFPVEDPENGEQAPDDH
jgi:peroxiredoxin